MDLLLTRSFIAVVDAGSITEAADQLGVTQSALSRRLQQFEDQLGGALLVRSRKGVELTDIGQLVYTEGQRLISAFNQLREDIALHQGLETGRVRIGGGATAVSFVLPPAIAAFQSSYPYIRFQLKEAGSREIAEDVVAGNLELGIVTLPLAARELELRDLIADDIVLVARRGHPLAGRRHVAPDALADQGFVSFESGTALRKLIDNAVQAAAVDIHVVMELRSIPAILRMVATTGHLAFVSRMALNDSHPDIVEVRVQGLAIRRRMALVWRRHGALSVAAQAFVSELIRLAAPGHR